jgi:hypothetical protein
MSERYEVPPERLGRWLERWADAHAGIAGVEPHGPGLLLAGNDGATLRAEAPFPPLAVPTVDGLIAHVARERLVGVLLVRLGAHAVGVFEGRRLVASKVARRQVHGRNRKGGSSSGRFARRRENQADASLQAAADVAARILLPEVASLDAVVLGGDRRALTQMLEETRLAPLRALAAERVIDVPEPRLDILRAAPDRFLATVLVLADPVGPGGPEGPDPAA